MIDLTVAPSVLPSNTDNSTSLSSFTTTKLFIVKILHTAGIGFGIYLFTFAVLQLSRLIAYIADGKVYPTPGNIWDMSDQQKATAMIAIFFAPIIEEFFFRKLLITGLWRLTKSAPLCALISSLIFALCHQDALTGNYFDNISLLITRTALGLTLAILYLKSHSILMPVVAHMIHNILVLIPKLSLFYAGSALNFGEFTYVIAYSMIAAVGICIVVRLNSYIEFLA